MLKSVVLIRSRDIDPSIHKIAKALSNNGYNVKVLLWNRKGKRGIQYTNGYTVIHCGIKAPYDKISVAFFLPLWWLYEFFFLIMEPVKIVHACDLDTLLPAIIIKLIKRIKLCYSIYDFYADNILTAFTFIRKVVAFLEKFGIGLCDAIFIVDPTRHEQIKGSLIKKLVVLYNSPPDYFEREENVMLKAKAESNLILFYAGVIHRSRGLIEILKALRDTNGVKLIIAGLGPDMKILENLPKSLKNKVEYIGFIPYEEVIKKTFEADVILALYDPKIPNNRYASPNKLFEAMMCAKPIIINKETSAAKIVEKENCGLIVPYGDVNAIKNAIKLMKENCELRLQLGRNGRTAYKNRYNWRLMVRKLIHIYDQISESDIS